MNAAAKSTLVLGLGRTGYSVIAHLAARGDAARITAADSRLRAPCMARVREKFPRVRIIAGKFPSLQDFDRVIASPGVALESKPHARVIGDIELFAECARAPVVAITGSNGKSSVTTLVTKMLTAAGKRALCGGNLGTPALDLLDAPAPDFYVLELSSFQLENTYSLNAAAAAVLNISADHLDRHRDLQSYAAAKSRILDGETCARVLNRDDANSAQLLRAHRDARTFGLDAPRADEYGVRDGYLCRGQTQLAPLAKMKLQGAHHIANALAAFALLDAVGVAVTAAVVTTALEFAGLEHRCELVAEIDGVKWFNDSKATNVGATVSALTGMRGKCIWIGGGTGKDADFKPLQRPLQTRARAAVLFGRDADAIADALGGGVQILRARDLAHAVAIAVDAAAAHAAQNILFSPACASFDMFENYAARGDAFKREVRMRMQPAQRAQS